jgi:hypothetical protein
MDTIVERAHKLGEAIGAAERGRTFDHKVIEFTRLLGTIPDLAAREVTLDDIDALRRLSERVIEQIELRLEFRDDRQAIQRDLADAIYRIRSGLEEMDRWSRHYLGG